MQHIREEVLNRCLQRHAEEHVAGADKRDLPPSALSATLLFTQRKRDVAMFFDIDGDTRDRAVEEQEAGGGQEVED